MASKKSTKKTTPKSNKEKKRTGVSSGSNKFVPYAVLAVIGIMFFYYCKSFNFIQDDSYITYRYVKNFTDGHGLVFNLGEKVEGYTCFLWVIVLSFMKFIGINFVSASQTLGIISSLLVLFFTYKISEQIFPKNKSEYFNTAFSLAAVIMLMANGAFAYWTVSGMETGFFTLLVTLGIYLYLKEINSSSSKFPYSSAVFLMASLTRPEGNLIFAVTVLHKIIITIKTKPDSEYSIIKKLFSKKNVLWLGLYIVPALIYMVWRYSYYGYLLPNTFYAKTGSSIEYFKSGLDYFWEFAKSYGLFGVFIGLTLVNLKSCLLYTSRCV